SSDVSTNIAGDRLQDLPIMPLGARAGNTGVRNPFGLAQMVPGAVFSSVSNMVVNGMPNNSEKVRIDGQDATTMFNLAFTSHIQPSADAVQEVTVQTSNYAAEFGQTGGGLFNVTMKSGTNNYHGSVYDYYINEFLNAGQPYRPLDSKGKLPR